MIAPRYIPTELQTINFDRDFKKHQRKLDEITKQDRKKNVVDKESVAKAKLYEIREKNLKFHNSEKLLAIEKDNEILLGRLVEISRKKGGNGSNSHLPKTLNGPSRQREKDRIAQENEAFAKRLLSQQARFDRKKLETDYVKHLGLVKQMQRLEGGSTRKIKLPPLKNNQTTEEEKEDIAEEEERREKEEKEKARKEQEEKEQKEKKDKEEKETKENEAKEKKEKEEKEKAEKEEKEKKEKEEKEEKEKKEKEEAERKAKEEAEKVEKPAEQAQTQANTGAQGADTTATVNQTATKTPEELEKERLQKEEEEKKKNEQGTQ